MAPGYDEGVAGGDGESVVDGDGVVVGGDHPGFFWLAEGAGVHIESYPL